MGKCQGSSCGLLWLVPDPTDEELKQAYDDYYTHAPNPSKDGPSGASGTRLSRRLAEVPLSLLGVLRGRRALEAMDLEGIKPGRLLEVGCGNVVRLQRLQELGWTVEGQEVDPVAARLVRQALAVTVHEGLLEGLGLPAESYDAIVMNHVIEHVRDPAALVQECFRLLKPGGHLVSVTPNSESLGHKRFKQHWRGLEPPRHLVIFSPRNAKAPYAGAPWRAIKITTSVARAAWIHRASAQLRRWGRFDERAAPTWAGDVEAMRSQVYATLAHLVRKGSGEELVVHAVK
jgi:2-polyprenyl-3-methyl-5-hydroxy-6-metoxy-1,4-benzoquinol methylase